jgi:hypothetical protein
VNERALILLLEEWHRQLLWGLQSAIDALPDPVWNTGVFSFAQPTDKSSPEQWHWEERPRTPPMLVGLEATIARIGDQIERLRGGDDS